MKSARTLLTVVVFLFTTACFGQTFMDEPGIPAFTTSFPVEHGFINIANGALHLEIPIASYPQRGSKLEYHARLVYDSRFWTSGNQTPTQSDWQPNGVPSDPRIGIGWRLITDEESGSSSNTQTYLGCACQQGSQGPLCQTRTTYKNFIYQEPNGTNHRAPRSFTLTSAPLICGGPLTPSGSAYADDNSGYKFVVNNTTSVYGPDGTLVAGPGPVATQDINGNFSSYSPNGDVVDTLNRVPVITSTSGNLVFLDYLNPQGTRSRITLTTTTLNLATQFPAGNFTGTWPGLQSIAFPDNSSYQFQYDSYGQIQGLTLPTGGQVTYGYINFQGDNTFLGNRWLNSRTTPLAILGQSRRSLPPAPVPATRLRSRWQPRPTVTVPPRRMTLTCIRSSPKAEPFRPKFSIFAARPLVLLF